MGLLSALRCTTRMANGFKFSRFNPLLSPTSPLRVASVTRPCSSYLNNLEPVNLFDSPTALVSSLPVAFIRNMMFNILIRGYFDPNYSLPDFKAGAVHSISHVSQLLANGQFDDMEGLVTPEVITKLRHRYMDLNENQQNWIAVHPKDCVAKRCEIGVILIGEQRFVEVTVAVHGIHGFRLFQEEAVQGNLDVRPTLNWKNHFQCNYRFVRDYTKGESDSWTINRLNHFVLVKQLEEDN